MFITINYSIILIACVLIRWHWIRSFHSAFPGTTYKRPRSLDDWRAKRMSAEESIPVNEETEGLPRSGEIHRIHPHYPPFMERQTNASNAVRIRFLSCSRLDVGVRYFRWQRRWQSDVNGFFTQTANSDVDRKAKIRGLPSFVISDGVALNFVVF